MSKKEYPAKLTTGYYRVREVWEDEASQFGAYRLLANAKAKCDENPGSRVFDNDGNVIYPEEAVPDTGADESEEKAVVDDISEDEPETTTPVEDTPAEKEAEVEVDEDEFPTAEELPATIAYGKLKTLMNIRKKPSLDAEVVAVYKKNALVEVVQFCDGIGSQTIQHTDICTAAAASQFLICDFPEIITGNNGIDPASCERIGVRTVQDICDTGLCFGTFDLQPAITELHDFQCHPGRHETADPVTTE